MSDRSIQVALLVVVICAVTALCVALIRHPTGQSVPELSSALGMLSGAVTGLVWLIKRPNNGNGGGPKLLK